MKCRYDKGDLVETPLGPGEIISDIEITGRCIVRLNEPLKGGEHELGEQEGQRDITANTFQLRHVKVVP